MNFTQTGNGLATDKIRASDGHLMDEHRAENGHSAAIVLEKDACRAGASVFVGCSFCVRSRPVWRSSCVGSCGVRARRLTGGSQRRRIVEVKHKAVDATRAGHGRDTDCARTGDGRASVRLGRIQLSQDGRRCAVDGLATGLRRADNGLLTDYTRACLRTYDGRAAVAPRSPPVKCPCEFRSKPVPSPSQARCSPVPRPLGVRVPPV